MYSGDSYVQYIYNSATIGFNIFVEFFQAKGNIVVSLLKIINLNWEILSLFFKMTIKYTLSKKRSLHFCIETQESIKEFGLLKNFCQAKKFFVEIQYGRQLKNWAIYVHQIQNERNVKGSLI